MDLRSFKQQMTSGQRQPTAEAPTELDEALLALVSGGVAPPTPGGVGGFANATWSKSL